MNFLPLHKQVILKPYSPREPLPYTLATDAEILSCTANPLIVDTEIYPNYFLILFKDIVTNRLIEFTLTFNEIKLSWIMHNYKTISFNGNKYDLPMIWASVFNQDNAFLKNVSDAIIYQNLLPVQVKREFHFPTFPTNHIDLIEVCPLSGSLKFYGARIHVKRIQDLPFNPNTKLNDADIPIVYDYCHNDLDTTAAIYNFSKERLELRSDLSIRYKEDLRSKSDAQIAEAIITRAIKSVVGKWPKRPEIERLDYKFKIPSYMQFQTETLKSILDLIASLRFQLNTAGGIETPKELKEKVVRINNNGYTIGIGGLHSIEETVSFKSDHKYQIYDRDVVSYYPRIILNQNLYPEHIGEAFIKVYNAIVEQRIIAKRKDAKVEAQGLKIIVNGTSGKFNDIWSKLRSPASYIQMTLTGQLSLLMMIEAMELEGISIISANTDGIVMLCPHSKQSTMLQIISRWEQQTNFETEETKYSAYYARNVNNYFAVKDKEVKVKGAYSEVGSQSGTQLDTNPTTLICSDAIKSLLLHETPIEKTIRACQDITRFVAIRNVKGGAHKDGEYLGKVVRWYYAKGIVGTINYLQSNNKVADTEGAKPAMDLPLIFPNDIDFNWYIKRTTEMLEDIDYIKRPKQISFF